MSSSDHIQQWRRMIQPARSRTPAADTDDSEGVLSPRKGLKPKLSSYFTQQNPSSLPSRTVSTVTNNAFHQNFPSWSNDEPIPDPDVNKLVDSLMSRLLAEPYYGLDSRFNGTLLQIFECFRTNQDDKDKLQLLLHQEIDRRSSLERAMHDSAQKWSRQREEFQAEIRRLELIIAKGERGLAEVTLARQDSLLRYGQRIRDNITADKTLETVFEFLERTRRLEDERWSSQRATMRRPPTSPSASMRRLSKTFINQPSTTGLQFDVPSGTPYDVSLLERARQTTEHFQKSYQIDTAQQHNQQHALDCSFGISEMRTSSSADTLSTFSCDGDLLPDETADPEIINVALADTNLAKHPRLRRKATEFYSKLKPQLNIDTLRAGRRFSFEPGDDTEASLSAPPLEKLPAAVKDRLLRKSVSLSVLSEGTQSKGAQRERALSPVQQSPTTSAPPLDCRKPTMIPTPIHSNGSLARPRQEREDSSSSLLTAIRHIDETCQRSDSASASAVDSPYASTVDLMQENQENQAFGTSTAASNPLLDHTNNLRGNAFAAAAAKAASAITTNADHGDLTDSASSKRPRVSGSNGRTTRGLTQPRTTADMSELRKENGEPMMPSVDFIDQKNNATL